MEDDTGSKVDLDSGVSKEQAQRLAEVDSFPIQEDQVEKFITKPKDLSPVIRKSSRAKKTPAWRDEFVR